MDNATTGDTGRVEERTTGFDIESASDRIGDQFFPPNDTTEPLENEEPVPDEAAAQVQSSEPATEPAQTPESSISQAPKSWPKEMHDHWSKTPKEVQDYWQTREKQMLDGIEQYKQATSYGKSLSDILAPYQPLLQSKGIDAPRAITDLMQAYTAMTQGTPEQRRSAYEQIGKNLGIPSATGEASTPVDPQVKALQDQFNQIQQTLTAQQTEALNAAREKAGQEVEAFAADKTHI